MKTLIITGGSINIDWLKTYLMNKSYNLIIAVDKGLEALDLLCVRPNYIIGDFDSINKTIKNKYKENIIKLNPEKDFTDTHMALKLAIEEGSTEIEIIGAIGTRQDHTLANIHILKEALEKKINCTIINENNKIFLINKHIEIKNDEEYKYISLIPLTTKACGITLKGMKYTLDNQDLEIGHSIGVSNEQVEETAEINLKEGILIVIYSKD